MLLISMHFSAFFWKDMNYDKGLWASSQSTKYWECCSFIAWNWEPWHWGSLGASLYFTNQWGVLEFCPFSIQLIWKPLNFIAICKQVGLGLSSQTIGILSWEPWNFITNCLDPCNNKPSDHYVVNVLFFLLFSLCFPLSKLPSTCVLLF